MNVRSLLAALAIGGGLTAVWEIGMAAVVRRRAHEGDALLPGDVEVRTPPPVRENSEALLARACRSRRRTAALYAVAGAVSAGVLAAGKRRRIAPREIALPAALLAAVTATQTKTLAPLLALASVPMGVVLVHHRPRFALAAPLAFLAGCGVVAGVGKGYERKLFSDVFFRHAFAWTFVAAWSAAAGAVRVRHALLAPAAFVAAAAASMPMLRRAALRHEPVHLLVLRVFGPAAQTHRLMERIGRQWRGIGPIHLIAGPDSVVTNLDLGEFAGMFTGRSRNLYAAHPHDHATDPDGRYRINDFFCSAATWQSTVRELLGHSHAVLVDLTGRTDENKGIQWEIELLESQARAYVTSDEPDLLRALCDAVR